MIHAKKILPEYFEAMKAGKKLFELRRLDPDEPGFVAGDFLAVNEWKDGRFTGRCLLFRITYLLDAAHSCDTLREGCVALGLRLMPIGTLDLQMMRRE